MRKDVGRANVLYVHVTLLPELAATGELKTKPTQHSVKELRGIGIQPDVIVLRSDHEVPDEIREKIALFTDVATDAVIPAPTAETIYEVPLQFEDFGLGRLIVRELGLGDPEAAPDLAGWRALVEKIKRDKPALEVALVGKYIELPDAYLSVTEALKHAGWANDVDVKIRWVDSEALTKDNLHDALDGAAGIVVPGGFGHRGIEGKVLAAHFARDHKVPYLGLCLGLQCAVIEFAREVVGSKDVNSTEFDMFTTNPVIDFMPDQRELEDKGGTMRLGLYPAKLTPGSKAAAAYGQEVIYERHRHRFEVNNQYRADARGRGHAPVRPVARWSARRDRRAPGPPMVRGSQFHPEFKSRPERPHPLFDGFVRAALADGPLRRSASALDARRVTRLPSRPTRPRRPARRPSRSRPELRGRPHPVPAGGRSGGRRLAAVGRRSRRPGRRSITCPRSTTWRAGMPIPMSCRSSSSKPASSSATASSGRTAIWTRPSWRGWSSRRSSVAWATGARSPAPSQTRPTGVASPRSGCVWCPRMPPRAAPTRPRASRGRLLEQEAEFNAGQRRDYVWMRNVRQSPNAGPGGPGLRSIPSEG